MKGIRPAGDVRMVVKRRRMTDEDLLIDRDLMMLEKHYGGRTHAEVARIFRVSQQLVSYRFKHEIPAPVREGMAELVKRYVQCQGFDLVPDEAKELLRRVYRRHRRQRQRIGSRA